jgi:hypothetical protein
MRNSAVESEIRLGGTGIDKIIGWGMNNEVYKKLFVHIPEIMEKAVFIDDLHPYKSKSHYHKYNHFVAGIKMDNKPYTVHIILGENNGQWYYSSLI